MKLFNITFILPILSKLAFAAPIPGVVTVVVTQVETVHRGVSYTLVNGVTSTVFYDLDHGTVPILITSSSEEPITSTIQVYVTSTATATTSTSSPQQTTSAPHTVEPQTPISTSTYVPETTTPVPTTSSTSQAPAWTPTTSTTVPTETTSSTSTAPVWAPTTTSTTPVWTPATTAPTTTSTTETATSTSSSSTGVPTGQNAGQGTYYDTGLGACGITNTDSDFIVAISKDLFDSANVANPNDNPFCNKQITANYQGNSVTVTVTDRCEGCAIHDLDFSPSAFNNLASESLGRIDIDWDFIN